MSVSVIHYSSKIFFLILNFLSFYLHACNVSENTVYKIIAVVLFWGDSKEGIFICTLLYRTRFRYSFY
ncbi:hypothetical protein CN470_28910 [Bacillus cereus]|nr:hypothetical protein CN470_28910 [Bacillus cereus]TKH98944.1 hypothetical protein FC693_09010 [Bacillus cereus]